MVPSLEPAARLLVVAAAHYLSRMDDISPRLTGEPAFSLGRPVMTQDWLKLSAVHWRFDAAEIESKLPEGLAADLFDGSGWVGLIPFHMKRIAAPIGPPIPYLGTFPETNIRTYVTGPAGPGIWFHSLDISRLLPVLTARLSYKLPYMWAKMSLDRTREGFVYRCLRRWPRSKGVASHVAVEVGDRIAEPSQLEHFLSARWGLYTMLGRRLAFAKVEHEPWPLHQASIASLDDGLLAAAGYTKRGVPDHVMYSPGVSVKIERPRFVAAA